MSSGDFDTKGDFREEGRNPFVPIERIDNGTTKGIGQIGIDFLQLIEQNLSLSESVLKRRTHSELKENEIFRLTDFQIHCGDSITEKNKKSSGVFL